MIVSQYLYFCKYVLWEVPWSFYYMRTDRWVQTFKLLPLDQRSFLAFQTKKNKYVLLFILYFTDNNYTSL